MFQIFQMHLVYLYLNPFCKEYIMYKNINRFRKHCQIALALKKMEMSNLHKSFKSKALETKQKNEFKYMNFLCVCKQRCAKKVKNFYFHSHSFQIHAKSQFGCPFTCSFWVQALQLRFLWQIFFPKGKHGRTSKGTYRGKAICMRTMWLQFCQKVRNGLT